MSVLKGFHMPEVYRTNAVSTGDGRNGHARTTDGLIDVDLVTPKEQGGPGGATNPEQLFAAGYAGCFHSSLKVAARGQGITLTGSTVTVTVSLLKDDSAFTLAVAIAADLPGVPTEQGEQLLEQAHQRCPYSKATRGNIDVQLTLGHTADAAAH
jgi:osmotically inducible protein OsmC